MAVVAGRHTEKALAGMVPGLVSGVAGMKARREFAANRDPRMQRPEAKGPVNPTLG